MIFIIKVGQEFKTLQELSLTLLGKRLPKGKGHTDGVNKMKLSVNWEKIPGTRRLIITEVYDKKKVKLRKTAYTPQLIANLLSLDFSKSYTKHELYVALGLITEKYTLPKYYVDNLNLVRMTLPQYKLVLSDIECTLDQLLFRILKKVKNDDILQWSSNYEYIYSGPKPDELPPIEDIRQELIHSLGYDNEWTVYHSKDRQLFSTLLKEKLSSYGVSYFKKVYTFSDPNKPDNLPEPNTDKMLELCYKKLQKHLNAKNYTEDYMDKINALLDTYFTKQRF